MPSFFGARPRTEVRRVGEGGGGAFLIPRLWRPTAARVLFDSFGAGSRWNTQVDITGNGVYRSAIPSFFGLTIPSTVPLGFLVSEIPRFLHRLDIILDWGTRLEDLLLSRKSRVMRRRTVVQH